VAHIEKRRVTMRTTVLAGQNEEGQDLFQDFIAEDYVPVEILDAYVADARTRWQTVTVGEEHEDGPGGQDGKVVVPKGLDHELAGKTLAKGRK
jgi:hypothetical protein